MINFKRHPVLLVFIAAVLSVQANEDNNLIIGDRYIFDYGHSAYEITINSDSELTWTLVKGDLDGTVEETDNYIYTPITDGILMISWVENSGFGLSNVLNLNNGELTTHGRDGDTVFVNQGKITQAN